MIMENDKLYKLGWSKYETEIETKCVDLTVCVCVCVVEKCVYVWISLFLFGLGTLFEVFCGKDDTADTHKLWTHT